MAAIPPASMTTEIRANARQSSPVKLTIDSGFVVLSSTPVCESKASLLHRH